MLVKRNPFVCWQPVGKFFEWKIKNDIETDTECKIYVNFFALYVFHLAIITELMTTVSNINILMDPKLVYIHINEQKSIKCNWATINLDNWIYLENISIKVPLFEFPRKCLPVSSICYWILSFFQQINMISIDHYYTSDCVEEKWEIQVDLSICFIIQI